MKLKKILFQGQFSLIYNLAKLLDFEFKPFESSLSNDGPFEWWFFGPSCFMVCWPSTLDLSLAPDPFKRMIKNQKSENQSKFNSKMNSKHDFKRIDSDSSLLMDTDDKEVLKILQTAKKVLEKSLRQETRATRLLFGKFSKFPPLCHPI